MSLSQTIIFGMIFPLMFCSIGSLFARKGYVYFKAKKDAQFKKNVATRSSNLASHQIFYFIRNWKSIHSREKKWHL